MSSFKDRLLSRKFLAFLGAVLTNFGGVLTGELALEKAITSIVTLTITYITAEALVDFSRAKNGAEPDK